MSSFSNPRIVTVSPALCVDTVPLSVTLWQQIVSVFDALIVVVTGVGGGAFLIAAVAFDSETVLPNSFRAVTSTRIVCPTSALRTPYVCAVAPEMSVQPPPDASQRRHWNVNLSTAPPAYLP